MSGHLMSHNDARYVAKLQKAFSCLDKSVKNLGDAHFLAADEHKKLGTHDLLNQAIKVRDGLATLVDIAQKQAEGLIKRNPQAIAEEDQL